MDDCIRFALRTTLQKRVAEANPHSLFLQSRLYSKGSILGHKRGKRNSTEHTTLVKIEGVESTKDAQFYLGKVSAQAGPEKDVIWDGRRA